MSTTVKISTTDLAQIAMIAGLPKAPSSYNPIANPERALMRRNWILGRMLSLDNITRNSTRLAASRTGSTPLITAPSRSSDAAYIAEMVRQEVDRKFGLKAYTEGYSAITTIDSTMQKQGCQCSAGGNFGL